VNLKRRYFYPLPPTHNILLKKGKIYIQEGAKPKPSKIKENRKKKRKKNKKMA